MPVLSSAGVQPLAAFLSYRLGGFDGVSVEARKWMRAFEQLGFTIRRVAGELPGEPQRGDIVLPGLAIDPPSDEPPVEPATVLDALQDARLVVVENLCSLPLNLAAARAVSRALDRRPGRVLFHHHDLAWQRPHLAHLEGFPPRRADSLHVTINDLSRHELAARAGIAATTIHNVFDLDCPQGDRDRTRVELGFEPTDLVVLHPARAIPRKNVPGALRFTEQLATRLPDRTVRHWLTGPAEDGYGPVLDELLAATAVPVTTGRASTPADADAACDVVVFPSTWEGFGNPVIESVIARRPLAVGHYPALDEVLAFGFQFFSVDDPDAVAQWLRSPDPALLDHNLAVARRHFDLESLPRQLDAAFRLAGWTAW